MKSAACGNLMSNNVLEKTGWNRSKANKILGISYKTLLYKIQEFDLNPPYNW